jgi:YebC/PmpR family DNA-binding regulatory protein
MAGHSKWANIQHRKKAQDGKRAKLFTRLIREVVTAAREGGGDPDANPRLRLAIDKARDGNMTKDAIDRAVKRGSGDLGGEDYEEIVYEGYGVAGVAVMVECMTDNRNRTVAEVRHAFTKAGGNLGTDGSVAYLFSKQGQLLFASGADEDRLMEIGLEAGADDVVVNDDQSITITTTPEQYLAVKEAIEKNKLTPESAEITMIASIYVELEVGDAEKLFRLVDALEELDDVQEVYTNAHITEEVAEKLG